MKRNRIWVGTVLAMLAGSCFAVKPPDIKTAFAAYGDDETMPGFVSCIYAEGETRIDCIGYADIASKRKISENDLFWIASNSKGIACALVLTFVDEGKISLDAPVEQYLPEWRDIRVHGQVPKKKPTVRMVMGHRSGLPFFPSMPISQYPMRLLASKAVARGLDYEPDSEYRYSNWGIDIAVAICEVVAGGEPWDRLLKRRVLDPLGMNDTLFFPGEKEMRRMATSYRMDAAGKEPPKPITVDQLTFPYDRAPAYPEAGGGLFATPLDMMRFCRMIASGGLLPDGKRFLSEKAMAEWTGVLTGRDSWYTFGMEAHPAKGTLGHGGAYGTMAFANWKNNTVRIYFVQVAGNSPASKERYETWARLTWPCLETPVKKEEGGKGK